MKKLIRVREVEPLHDFVVRFTFTNGEERDIDLDQYIEGPIFQPLRDDPALFRAAYVAHGTISWPNGADIDPDTVYLGLPPDPSEEEWRAALAALEPARP